MKEFGMRTAICILITILGSSLPAASQTPSSVPHDSHDLTGTWTRTNRVLTMSNETPPMTVWGQGRVAAAKLVYGLRAVAGGLCNDPLRTCDPVGLPRNLFLEVSICPREFIHTPKRVLQHFEWRNMYRQIRTD